MHVEGLLAAILCIPEGGVGIADDRGVGDDDVRAVHLVDQRIAREGGSEFGNGWMFVDLQNDLLAGVLGDRGARRQHDRDGLADKPHPAVGDHRRGERLDLRQWKQPHRHPRHRTADILGGDDAVNARDGQRRRGIESADRAVGDRTAQDDGVQLPFG